jgi:hypothetical protein
MGGRDSFLIYSVVFAVLFLQNCDAPKNAMDMSSSTSALSGEDTKKCADKLRAEIEEKERKNNAEFVHGNLFIRTFTEMTKEDVNTLLAKYDRFGLKDINDYISKSGEKTQVVSFNVKPEIEYEFLCILRADSKIQFAEINEISTVAF